MYTHMDARSALVGAALGAAASVCVLRLLRPNSPPRGALRQHAPVDTAGVLATGKVAVIIGSGSGIGRCAALRCVALGMKVMLADIDVPDATSVQAECEAAGAPKGSVVVQRCDCRVEADVRAARDAAYAAFGAVHLLMNNAAMQSNNRCGPYEHPDRWKVILDTNLLGVYHGGLAFAPSMVEQAEPSVIVNTGSKQGITMPPGDTAYNVSKAGVKVRWWRGWVWWCGAGGRRVEAMSGGRVRGPSSRRSPESPLRRC